MKCTQKVSDADCKRASALPLPAQQHVAMHKLLLYLTPRHYEQEYFAQLEALDFLNCIIAPVFFANALAMWTRGLLSTVYCVVLLIKGYQMGLLLLPAARQAHAHRKARYWLILGERVLRQFIATPALGRGPRFIEWLQHVAATSSPMAVSLKLLMLVSGFTISFWNAFCLPLDFVSQVVVNLIFFCIHFPPTVTQVAYAMRTLLRRKPQLVWLQWWTEHLACKAVQGLGQLLSVIHSSSTWLSGSMTSMATAPEEFRNDTSDCVGSRADTGHGLHACANSAEAAVAQPMKPAPDLDSVAGRLIMALSTAWMLFMVLYLPLYLVWRFERHFKSKFMSTCVAPAQQQLDQEQKQKQCQELLVSAASNKGDKAPSDAPKHVVSSRGSSSFVCPPVVFPFMPTSSSEVRTQLGVAAVVCCAAAELFVWLCVWSPAVKACLWPQMLP